MTKDIKELAVRLSTYFGNEKISDYQKSLMLELLKRGQVDRVKNTLDNFEKTI